MKLVIGISGASGAIYGIRLLQVLKEKGIETHLVISEAAAATIRAETDWTRRRIEALARFHYGSEDIAARIASGSFETSGMVIIPCSIKTLSAVANSYAHNLMVRAADVTLKERRKLVLVVRETPLHLGHLRLMAQASEIGAVILPPMPAFYHSPSTVSDIVDQTVGKVLEQFGIEHRCYRRWEGMSEG
ncbi:MAG: UbiX family flavin prenyltransferase [Dehalococcoidia bacterium]|nr:MAG: UbiX family flavin prenyltransferase [Dehalococcoidia bacterium]